MNADSDQFVDLALEHINGVHRMAALLTGRCGDAADLVMATYVVAAERMDRFRAQALPLRLWLLQLVIDTFRRSGAGSAPAPAAAPPASNRVARHASLPPLDEATVTRRIGEAVDGLDAESRALLVLWSVERLTETEISDVLDLPAEVVRRRLHRARGLITGLLCSPPRPEITA